LDPLVVCRTDLLYQPCTSGEIGWVVGPAVLLIILAAAVAAVALRHSRIADPASSGSGTHTSSGPPQPGRATIAM